MQCTSPRRVGFKPDNSGISFSSKNYDITQATFLLPCGKCISCRLEYARQWAVRCVHESMMHEKNSFITLTYSDEHLKSPKLNYRDFQLFMKKLRKTQENPIGVFVTGEYGDKFKRPHWHAIVFGYRPSDCEKKYVNDRGDQVFSSSVLSEIWGHGIAELGSVTFESAGYVARYAAKKLVHGNDGTHGYDPISKKSNKQAIGKKWLEKNWSDVFSHGSVVLSDGTTCGIPRYYEKWFKQHHPEKWRHYVTEVKPRNMDIAQKSSEGLEREWREHEHKRFLLGKSRSLSPLELKKIILEQKFKQLQEYQKC